MKQCRSPSTRCPCCMNVYLILILPRTILYKTGENVCNYPNMVCRFPFLNPELPPGILFSRVYLVLEAASSRQLSPHFCPSLWGINVESGCPATGHAAARPVTRALRPPNAGSGLTDGQTIVRNAFCREDFFAVIIFPPPV